jgi:hypothetical protein
LHPDHALRLQRPGLLSAGNVSQQVRQRHLIRRVGSTRAVADGRMNVSAHANQVFHVQSAGLLQRMGHGDRDCDWQHPDSQSSALWQSESCAALQHAVRCCNTLCCLPDWHCDAAGFGRDHSPLRVTSMLLRSTIRCALARHSSYSSTRPCRGSWRGPHCAWGQSITPGLSRWNRPMTAHHQPGRA